MSFCSKCGYKNTSNADFCGECGSPLIKEEYFKLNSLNSFDELLTDDNLKDIEAKMEESAYSSIISNISLRGAYNLRDMLDIDDIDWDGLKVLDKVKLIVESYVNVNYKTRGADLGNYFSNVINIDDRLDDSQQISTLIHELSHHLFSEIFEEVLMYRLSVKRTLPLEAFVEFSMQVNIFNVVMDEYCAHTVEGRFIPHGYQNYGSFNNLVNQFPHEEDIVNSVKFYMRMGNSFADDIIGILETFIDEDIRKDIKAQFKEDYNYPPSYDQIVLEINDVMPDEAKIEFMSVVLGEGFNRAQKSESEKMLNDLLEVYKKRN